MNFFMQVKYFEIKFHSVYNSFYHFIAVGIFHEQSRADRDRFVKVHWDNVS